MCEQLRHMATFKPCSSFVRKNMSCESKRWREDSHGDAEEGSSETQPAEEAINVNRMWLEPFDLRHVACVPRVGADVPVTLGHHNVETRHVSERATWKCEVKLRHTVIDGSTTRSRSHSRTAERAAGSCLHHHAPNEPLPIKLHSLSLQSSCLCIWIW